MTKISRFKSASFGTIAGVFAISAAVGIFQNCSPGFEISKTYSDLTQLASEVPDPGSSLDTLPGVPGATPSPGSSPPPGGASPAPSTPFFTSNLAPILEARCIQCHSTGRIAARYNFQTSDSVARLGGAMLSAVDSGRMPPWGADNSGSCGTFKDDPHMSGAERATLAQWLTTRVQNGVPIPTEKNLAVKVAALPTLTPNGNDVVSLRMAAPYTPTPASGKVDDYRCFVLDAPSQVDRYVTGYEVKPGNPLMVHHVILYMPDTDADAARAEANVAGSADRSYPCFGGSEVAASPLVIWAPGTSVQFFPQGTGIKIPARRKLVLQMHYNTSATSAGAKDQSQVVLKTVASGVADAKWAAYTGDQSTPLPANTATIDRPAVQDSGVPTGSNGRIHGFFPHMHTRGRQISITRTPTGGNEQCLARVNAWDFNWQYNYFASQAIPIVPSDRMKVTCRFSTTGINTPTNFGEGTNDEMCYVFAYVTLTPPEAPTYKFELAANTGPNTSKTITLKAITGVGHAGQQGRIYVAAKIGNDFYYMNPNKSFVNVANLATDPLPAFYSGTLMATHLANLVTNADVSGLIGVELFIGYGIGATDAAAKAEHFNANRYAHVHTILADASTPPAAVTPAAFTLVSRAGGILARTITVQAKPQSDHVGKDGRIYVAAYFNNTWYFMKADGSYMPVADLANEAIPSAFSGILRAQHTLNAATSADLSGLVGATVWIGYGLGATDTTAKTEFLNSARYLQVDTINP